MFLICISQYGPEISAEDVGYLFGIKIYLTQFYLLKHDHTVFSNKCTIIHINITIVGNSPFIGVSNASNNPSHTTTIATTDPAFQHLLPHPFSHQHHHRYIQHFQRHHPIQFAKPFD